MLLLDGQQATAAAADGGGVGGGDDPPANGGKPMGTTGGRGTDGRETGQSAAVSASRHKRGKSAPVAGGAAAPDLSGYTFSSGNHGAAAFRANNRLTKSESSGSGGGGKGGGGRGKKKRWSHGLEPGDHVVRWSHIALYPIQIHGIVLQVSDDDEDGGDGGGPGSVMLCDFGLTKCGGDNEEDGGSAAAGEAAAAADGQDAVAEAATEAASSSSSVSSSAAPSPSPSTPPASPTHGHHRLKSLTSSSTHRRLNVITLTTRRDIKKWRKVNYGGDGLFSSSEEGGGGKKSKWTAWLPTSSPKPVGSKSIGGPQQADGDDETDGAAEPPRNVIFPVCVAVGDVSRGEREKQPDFLRLLSSLEEELHPRDVTPPAAAAETKCGTGGGDAAELLRPFTSDDGGAGDLLRGFPPPPPLTAAPLPPPPPPPVGATSSSSSSSWGWLSPSGTPSGKALPLHKKQHEKQTSSSTAAILNSSSSSNNNTNKHGKGVLRKKQRMGFFGHGHKQKKRTSSSRRLERTSLFPIVIGEDLPEFLAVLSVDGEGEESPSSSSSAATTALHETTDEDEEKADCGVGYEPYRPSTFERTPSGHLRPVPPSPRSPTTTAAGGKPKLPKTDPVKLVLSRVRFLLEHEGEDGRSSVLPPYHVFRSNSECIAVWCKTGRWSTLQAAVFLHSTAVGNAKQMFLAVGGVAALNPLLIPAIAPLGIAYVGAPWLYLNQCKGHWERATASLTDEFWAWAVKDPDVFVEVIRQWSGLR